MENSHVTSVSDVDLLSVTTGRVDGELRLILSFRLNPESSFATTNFSIPVSQGIRLYRDLNNLCYYHEPMSAALQENPSLYKNYECCILDHKPVVEESETKKSSKKKQ
jgi:hypothetical protein